MTQSNNPAIVPSDYGRNCSREVPLSIGALWMVLKDRLVAEIRFPMVLKDHLVGEIGLSCSKVTDVATISNLIVSSASGVRTYIVARVHTW